MNYIDYTQELAKQISELQAKLNQISNLHDLFPDIEIYRNRWDTTYIISESVNAKATDFSYKHSCGCCPDSAFLISPYVDTEYGKVYSKPCEICVGEKCAWGYGNVPHVGWKDDLKSLNISNVIIEKVKAYFEENPYGSYDGDDED